MKTIRLIYPQWQGGDIARWIPELTPDDAARGYYLGALLLDFLAPRNGQATFTVPVTTAPAAREAVDSRDDARKLEYARAAERLYVGDLYVPTLDATGFISSMRESLRNLYADAMVEGSAAALRLGRERTATRLAENAVRANELREDANSALVRALRACGRGVEADRRLRSFEARLRRGRGELTAAPDETAGQ